MHGPPERSELRGGLRAGRREPEPAVAGGSADAARCAHLAGMLRVLAVGTVAGYLALPGEPDPAGALEPWRAAGGVVLMPVLLPDRDLRFLRYDGTHRAGPHGLREPTDTGGPDGLAGAELVVVPALAVDHAGVRLGQGGGSYDRALARRAPGVTAVALLREAERVPHLDAQPWDSPVDAVITPAGLWWVTR